MRLVRIIWKDIVSLNARFTFGVKVAGLVFLLALVVAAYHLGADWWNQPVVMKRESRPRWGVAAFFLTIGFICYVLWVIERYRKKG